MKKIKISMLKVARENSLKTRKLIVDNLKIAVDLKYMK